ncbi:hypothetical protein DL770_003942 [Monosporascus sp. CRB-9-2]|nr:hypothetical protein DL770_003942 [Monosporascus sp. CRB-9-2]
MLPQNRRLRHLQGIYLRNLSFSVNRGRTIDDLDADLKPNTNSNHSSNKLEAQGDDAPGPQLHQSQSSESLRPLPKGRRRSTNLANISPMTRQKRLEYAVESRAADVFFSLHCEGVEYPVYISEVGERAMNFNFRFFDLSELGPFVTRSSVFTVKVWAKRWHAWSLLLEQHVDLRSINYLGTLRNHQFPPNCLVFHLADGIYCLELSGKRPEPKQGPVLPTSSYNALMKLSNLDNSIQDALATRETLTAQINEILERTPSNNVPQVQESALLASKYLSSQRRSLKAAQARRAELQASIGTRRKAIRDGREAQSRAEADVQHAQSKLSARAQLAATREGIRGQRRRICEDLAAIFPIAPPRGPGPATGSGAPPPLSFGICGVALPNTDYDPASSSATEDSLSAALGYVAQLVDLLQYYLCVPLPYPVTPFGSRSSVRDDISLLPEAALTKQQHQKQPRLGQGRDFPLFLRGGATAQYRFDYAWFLLNKDIEALCVAGAGLKVVDIRHTLPNLKYLLYVCSAGTDEVPERRRGGVRGLWAGRMRKSRAGIGSSGSADGLLAPDDAGSAAGSSRRGSIDSEAVGGGGGGARLQEQLRLALAKENGHGVDAAGLPFDEGTKLTLRTKGLREDVGAHA